MRRFKRGKKPSVRWLQDTADTFPPVIANSTNGCVQTFTVDFLKELQSSMPDPAEVMLGSIASAEEFRTPRAQLLVQPGWRMMRTMGHIYVGMSQGSPGETGDVSRGCIVRAGLCIMETDEAGTPIDFPNRHLVPPALPIDDDGRGAWSEGMGQSAWLWMRSWRLGNAWATGVPSQTSKYRYASSDGSRTYQDTAAAVSPSGVNLFDVGPGGNWMFQSVQLGSYFDIKRHVTLKQDQALFWRIGAFDIDGNASAKFGIEVQISNRVLIARPGRTYREKP